MQLVLKDNYVLATHEDGQVLVGLYPGCEVVSYAGAIKPGDPDPRTDREKMQVYRDQRRQAYPPLADQLDMIYHDQVNGTTTWQDMITAVKDQHPKPTPL